MLTRPRDEQWERFWDLVNMVSDSNLELQHVASQALSGTWPQGWLRAGAGHEQLEANGKKCTHY